MFLKNSSHLLGTAEMRFRLIEDQRDIWPVRVMCDALSVSPSGFYAWRSQPESARKIANRELLVDIRRVHAEHRGRYGAPRIHAELRAEGQSVSRKRVERVIVGMAFGLTRHAAIACVRPTASIPCRSRPTCWIGISRPRSLIRSG